MDNETKPTNLPAVTKTDLEWNRGLVIKTASDAARVAKEVCNAGLAPASFTTPAQVFMAIQFGAELGLSIGRSLQSLCVVEGNISIRSKAARAIVAASPLCEYIKDNYVQLSSADLDDDSTMAWVEIKRTDQKHPVRRSFSIKEAKRAGLWGKTYRNNKPSPWILYPVRMLHARALSYACNDAMGDVLLGLVLDDELRDYPPEALKPELQSGEILPPKDLDEAAARLDDEPPSAAIIDVEHVPSTDDSPASDDPPTGVTPDEQLDPICPDCGFDHPFGSNCPTPEPAPDPEPTDPVTQPELFETGPCEPH